MAHKIRKNILLLAMLMSPAVSFAQGLVGCDGSLAKPCDYNAFMDLINTLIRFALFDLSLPVAAIMFAYAGFLMVSSGGSTESKSKAKSIFTNTLLGLIFAIAAYLIIKTILFISGYQGAWIGF